MTDRNCENWSTNKQPLTDRAKAICKRLTDRAHQSDKLLDYDLLMTAVEVIGELQQALNGSGDGLTPDESKGDAP